MNATTKTTWMAVLAALVAACGGGGAGGGGGANAVPSIGALTGTSQLAAVAMADAATTFPTGKGPLGFTRVGAVALDPASGVLYGVFDDTESGGAVLLSVDPAAGARGLAAAPRVVGSLGDAGAPSTLVWHPGEGMLYGVQAPGGLLFPGTLLRIDPATGAATTVGTCAKVRSLAYDPATDALYGVEGSGFHRIRTSDGSSLELFSESALLPHVTSLALDPASGTFRAARFDQSSTEGPRMTRIDLFGSVDDLGHLDEQVVDLETTATGGLLGLGSGGSIADVSGSAGVFTASHRGNLGLELFDLVRDPASGGYWGIDATNHLVKLFMDGRSRTIGLVEIPTRQLVYDALDHQLWGFGSETIFTNTDLYVYGLDGSTAAVTGGPVLAQVSAGTRFTYDPAGDVIRAISGANDVSLLLDPITGSTSLATNAHSLDDVVGLAWDAARGRLVAMTADAQPERRQLTSWEPTVSGPGQLDLIGRFDGFGLEGTGAPGRFVSIENGVGLLEIELGDVDEARSLGGLRRDVYSAAHRVGEGGPVFATAHDGVYSIDPVTGGTRYVGGTPGSGTPSGLAWDPEAERLGFVAGDEVRWSSRSAPWNETSSTSLEGRNVRKITHSAARGVFYLVGPDGVFTMARNASGASFVQVSGAAPPDTVKDITWRDGALWAAMRGGDLYRVDPDSGAWTVVGRAKVELQGLY